MLTETGDAAVLAKLRAGRHPVAWTLTSLDAATEARIRELVKKAVA